MDRKAAFGKRLKAIRDDRGYSQERLADLAGLHRTYIGGVERGERNVSLLNIWRIADALGVGPSALLAPVKDPTDSEQLHTLTSGRVARDTSRKDRSWLKRRRR
jgi:transcriptional regulator with XRE-family HTH domain